MTEAAMVERVMGETRIKDMKHRLIRHLSKGYKQRVGLAQALLGDPEVLILDEPMVGLDPKQIIEIRELIRGLGQKHTVILSSHILSEITSVCDHVLIISHGKLVASDTPENLGSYMKHSDAMELQVRGSKEACEQAMELLKQVEGLEVRTTTATLEDVFLELTDEENNGNSDAAARQEKSESFHLGKRNRKQKTQKRKRSLWKNKNLTKRRNSNMCAIYKKELRAYLTSMTGYIFMAVLYGLSPACTMWPTVWWAATRSSELFCPLFISYC